MTEPTESGPSSEQLDRIAQLRARRGQSTALPDPAKPVTTSTDIQPTAAPSRRSRRRHVAQGSRILAAGLGVSTMFGIVWALGLDRPVNPDEQRVTTPGTPAAVAPASPPIEVVIHRIPPSPVAQTERALDVDDVLRQTPVEAPAAADEPSAPIVLTADPVVQTVTVAAPARTSDPAPAATTRGSN